MIKESPLVAIILPVYNGQKYLRESIDSILNQLYSNFSFIIIDDGSTDCSADIIQTYKDSRIKFIQQTNHGLAHTLNTAIKMTDAKYIARQDQDDISKPNRILDQISYMEANIDVCLLGSYAQLIVEDKYTNKVIRYPHSSPDIKFYMMFNNPFIHTSVVIRSSILDKVGLYSTDLNRQPPEDYELWSRIARQTKVANLEKTLVYYRSSKNSMSQKKPFIYKSQLITISAENIANYSTKYSNAGVVKNISLLMHDPESRFKKPIFNFKNMSHILLACSRNIYGRKYKIRRFLKCWVSMSMLKAKSLFGNQTKSKIFGTTRGIKAAIVVLSMLILLKPLLTLYLRMENEFNANSNNLYPTN